MLKLSAYKFYDYPAENKVFQNTNLKVLIRGLVEIKFIVLNWPKLVIFKRLNATI